MRVEYSSNNSGGGWWLDDADWVALEKAGWVVLWGGKYFCHPTYGGLLDNQGPNLCPDRESCQEGHVAATSAEDAERLRWLGSLAREAYREAPSAEEAIREWERVTGKSASDEGCNCCGPPHNFSWTDDDGQHHYASGDDVLPLLYGDGPKTLRDAVPRPRGAHRRVHGHPRRDDVVGPHDHVGRVPAHYAGVSGEGRHPRRLVTWPEAPAAGTEQTELAFPETWAARFAAWRDTPDGQRAYTAFVGFLLEDARAGRRVSAKAAWEAARRATRVKMNNGFHALAIRAAEDECPELRGKAEHRRRNAA